jgi:hypothetical protein
MHWMSLLLTYDYFWYRQGTLERYLYYSFMITFILKFKSWSRSRHSFFILLKTSSWDPLHFGADPDLDSRNRTYL